MKIQILNFIRSPYSGKIIRTDVSVCDLIQV